MGRPFFSYYGSKWQGARHLGSPRAPLVIEPFAGSACYSTRWEAKRVRLYDVSPDICALWNWLLGCSVADIERIPDSFESMSEIMAMPIGPQMLARFWVAKGRAEPSGALSPWYFQWRSAKDCRVWGPAVKARIIAQRPIIDQWSIEQKSWDEIPVVEAHYHVDPPYNNTPGSRYPHSDIDYRALGSWCRSLPGHVDVCENSGADWLPFRPLYEVVSCRGRRTGHSSKEAVWQSTGDPA